MVFEPWDGPPFDDWYHCMGNTYGTWLPGDRRGFRTRHHREDVPYDYRNPPPHGTYDALNDSARGSMRRPPIYLTFEQRARVVEEFVKALSKRNIPLRAFAIDRIHMHAIIQCRDHDPRRWLGIAKKESSHYMKVDGLAPLGGLWAVRTECLPVKDSMHLDRATSYILDHAKRGAAVYSAPSTPTELAPWDRY